MFPLKSLTGTSLSYLIMKTFGGDIKVRSQHDVGSWDDNGCDRFSYLKIDGVVMVRNSKIDTKAYSELLNK